ncbi:helix-turn-helix domain-containing protein [Chromobacterium violaceum]|uniref:helix-turn-helix domain-containing protein n=2 Tax=Chromobacterium violaceum TaxID=536 RepID=UPI0009B861B0|nr:helix-turn-helix transcriptional regulator [Chromobacterium violaceum]
MELDYRTKVHKKQLEIDMTMLPNPDNIQLMVEEKNTETQLSRNISTLMQLQGLTPKPFSKKVPVTYEMMRRYMSGAARPRPEKLAKLAELLGVTTADLEYGSFSADITVTSPTVTIVRHDAPMPPSTTPPDRTVELANPQELASWLVAQGDDALATFLRALADTLQKK